MGFVSFLGRVLFASIFILSAWQAFNEFGVDGGPAAKDLVPKFNVFKKNLSSKLGVELPHIDVKHLAVATVALKGVGGILFILNSSFGASLLLLQLAFTTPLIYDFYNYSPDNTKFGILLNDFLQDYLKTVVPSQLLSERGSNLVVINPGSANIRIGLASQDTPLNFAHCIARHTTQVPRRNVQDQVSYTFLTSVLFIALYGLIASFLKIPFLDEEVANNSYPRKMGRVDGYNPQNNRKEPAFDWTDVYEKDPSSSSSLESSENKGTTSEALGQLEDENTTELGSSNHKYKKVIFGEEAQKISPMAPYTLRRPIRRGHLNISQHYPMQQVLEDVHAIWDFILTEKLHIPLRERNINKGIVVYSLADLRFSSAVVHQEGLAAAFGNGLSTACVVKMGAQVTSVICIEDGVALPTTEKTLPFGGEDISRCFLWTQRHHQTWPQIRTDMFAKPIDLLMLNRLKESCCEIKEGELDAVGIVHSYEDGLPPGSHKTRLTALNVPPMGLFFPMLLVPDAYPPPPSVWFRDYEDMLEDTWHMEFPRRPEMPEGMYPSMNVGYPMWDTYPVFAAKPKKEEKVGLAEAITSSILSTGRIDLQRKLFCSIQLVGGVALTRGLVPAVEERVLHTIPSNEAIDTVEVLQPRANPSFVSWKGGAILGILDFGRDAWIHRDDWSRNGIHIGSGRKYKDSYFLQAQAMCYINS
ncbi:actin-related protein 9 [Prunus yedoensis var. nudiflora]|uniref:Actin-related protein 9 n=1 Tax=Prunus yedoensis var. nudiflora TaxID=2094558 RepID=A0A314UWQ4_PRUYE|nr:actin-related protein 9 [Prunus yedoensis var. nudiflora]